MSILYILCIIAGLWLISKLMIFLIEVGVEHGTSRSVRRRQHAVERNIEKKRRTEEAQILPLVKRYQTSPFISQLIDKLTTLKAFDHNDPVDELRLKQCSVTLYQHNKIIHAIQFSELGYQALPDDRHLIAVARVLNARLGDNYQEDICMIDLVGTPGINYIRFQEKNSKRRAPLFLSQLFSQHGTIQPLNRRIL